MVTMDWLGKLLGLPEEFLNENPGYGGGVLQVGVIDTCNYIRQIHNK